MSSTISLRKRPHDFRTGYVSVVIRRLRSHLLAFVIGMAVAAIFVRSWVDPNVLPGGTDAVQYATSIVYLSNDLRFLYIWQSGGLGAQWLIGFANIATIPNLVLNNPVLTVKALFFGSIALAYVSSYFLCFSVSGNRTASLFASLVYVSSQPYVRYLSTAGLNLLFSYSIAPISLLFLYLAAKSGSWRWAFAHSLTVVLMLISRPDFILYWAPLQVMFLIGFVMLRKDGSIRTRILRIVKTLSLSLSFVVLASAFEWVPLLLGPVPLYLQIKSVSNQLQGQDIFSSVMSLPNPAGYMAAYLGSDPARTLGSIPLPLYLVLIAFVPALSFSALILSKNRIALAIAIPTFLNIFLAKGPQEPLAFVNSWLFTRVWPLTLLYDTSRWLMPVVLGYSLLTSIALARVLRFGGPRLSNPLSMIGRLRPSLLVVPSYPRRGTLLGGLLLTLTILSALVAAPSPWTSGLCTLNPYQAYLAPYQWLANQPSRGIVMPIPYATFYSDGSWLGSSCGGWHNDIGYVSAIWSHQALLYPGGPPSSELRYITPFFGHYIGGLILTNGTGNLGSILGPLGVGYIVSEGYPPTEQGLSGNLGQAVPPRSSFYEQEFITHQTDIRPVYSMGNSTVYVNPNWKPIIYSSSEPYLVIGGADALNYLASANIDISSHPLVFADQNPSSLLNPNGLRMLFTDSDLADLTLLLTKPIAPVDLSGVEHPGFTVLSNPLSTAPYNIGSFESANSFIYTNNEGQIPASFSVPNDCSCVVYVHGIFASNGKILASVDNSITNSSNLSDNIWAAPHWTKLVSGQITAGQHNLVIQATPSSPAGNYVAIDAIDVYDQAALQHNANVWLSETVPSLNETDFSFGTPSLVRLITTPDSIIPSPAWYQSAGGISLQTLWGGIGTLDLQGAKPGTYDIFARVASGVTNGSLTIVTSPTDMVTTSLTGTGAIYDQKLQSDAWVNLDPGYVTLRDVTSPTGPVQLEIDAQSYRPAYSLIQKDYSQPQNWSAGKYLSLALKGSQQDIAMIYFYFGNSHSVYAEYDAPLSSNWSTFNFDKAAPTRVSGAINWTDVTGLSVATAQKVQGETVSLGPYITSHDTTTSPSLKWVRLGSLPLDTQSVANVKMTGSMWLDQVMFLQGSGGRDSLNETAVLPELNWTRKGPNNFVINVNSSGQFNMMFEQSYDPRWMATIGSHSIAPVLADRYMMSFPLPPGQYSVNIQFNGDVSQWVGYGLSITVILVVSLLSVMPRVKRRLQEPRVPPHYPTGPIDQNDCGLKALTGKSDECRLLS